MIFPPDADIRPALCHSARVGGSISRSTIFYFVAAAVVGATAGIIHLFHQQLGVIVGTGMPLTVLTVLGWVLLPVAVLLVYRGMMRAAAEQDEAVRRRDQLRRSRRALNDVRRDDYDWHEPYIP